MSKLIEQRENRRTIEKDIVVLYHANCSDGFGGAWAAWKKFGGRAEYVAVYHQRPSPEGLKGKEIYMIDFTYPSDVLKELVEKNKKVSAIDHHESAEKATKMTEDYSFGLKNSGSVLAWRYFHPDRPIPLMLKYIEDVDLWKFELDDARAVFAYLDLFDFNFKTWDRLAEEIENTERRKEAVEKGRFLLEYQKKLIERVVRTNSEIVEFEGIKTYAVNSPDFRPEVADILMRRLPPIAIVWYQRQNEIMVSLKSDGSVDVSKLAQKYGGGGHVKSAGFILGINSPLPWKDLSNE